MAWQEFENKEIRRPRYTGMCVGRSQVSISRQAMTRIRKRSWRRISLHFDKKKKAIMVAEGDSNILAGQMGIRISTVMPTGRYDLTQELEKGFIFEKR